MMCSWCNQEYNDSPIYHVCADGSTMDQRSNRSADDYKREHERQERCRKARSVMGDQKALPASSANPAKIEWTSYDLMFLKGAKIAP